MVSKMAITSRGVTPSEFKAEATFSTVGISGKGTTDDLASVTSVVVRGVRTVWPVELNGDGWETSSVDATLMVMLPCETAQLEIRIRDVATIVPVRSLIMMRAGVSGVISMLSSRATKSTGDDWMPSGI